MSLQALHYKERKPIETVAYLKSILNEMQIETEEYWAEPSEADTYSLRVNFKGTTYGANGKGVTKEYALASAYAELFERYQNGCMGFDHCRTEEDERLTGGMYFSIDEKKMTMQELSAQENSLIKKYAEMLEETDFSDLDGKYLCQPYYNVKSKKVEFLPTSVVSYAYSTNGMSAGNTAEEAIIQAYAEIMERNVMLKLYLEKPALPDVPEKYMARYPEVFNMFNKIKKYSGYYVMMKDCSFGGRYPVAALVIIEIDTGRYGIKLGCHPDFGIAMERTITEAAQNRKIFEYISNSILDFKNEMVDEWKNINRGYRSGFGQYPYQLFMQPSEYPFTPCADVSSMGNREMMLNITNHILAEGYEIFIRDVSYTGFKSYHVIIPGMSEVALMSKKQYVRYKAKIETAKLAYNIKTIKGIKCKQFITGILAEIDDDELTGGLNYFFPNYLREKLPYASIGTGVSCIYFTAMCYMSLGMFSKAALMLNSIIDKGQVVLSVSEEKVLKAIKYYCDARMVFKEHNETLKQIQIYFSSEILDRLDYLFNDLDAIIEKQYSDDNCDNELMKLSRKYDMAMVKVMMNNHINQADMEKIFEM